MAKKNEEKKKLRFSQEQYDMLKRCSGKKDMTEWNEWRRQNPNCEVLLEGACLIDAYLEGANLIDAKFCPESEEGHTRKGFLKVYSERIANLQGTNLRKARLQNATLNGVCLKGADMSESRLQRADLMFAELEDAILFKADLQSCVIEGANIKGADISQCNLRNASFRAAIVDGATAVWHPQVSKCKGKRKPKRYRLSECVYTDFEGVALDSIRAYPKTKQLLEYNIRRMNWEKWYKEHYCLKWLVKPFWWMSDYGRSTGRIAGTFFVLAFFFAAIYSNMAYWLPPGIVSNLEVEPHSPIWHYFLLALLRPIYFSVVTMTTLGFGDMYANAQSIWGHILLTFQVILGYVLLGALVTRFAVLFTAGGPAGKFEKEVKGKRGH